MRQIKFNALKKLSVLFLFGILLILSMLSFSSSYRRSYPSYSQYGVTGRGNYYTEWHPDFDRCEAGQDFIVQIAPFGCNPPVVRSDLLEEQNVPVFCKLEATKLNPLIDVNTIDSVYFSGKYPKGVSGVGFLPAQAALGVKDKVNFPILDNIGYAIIVLEKQKNESKLPDKIKGNLTVTLNYDIENAFGIGRQTMYLPEISKDAEWNEKQKLYSFWEGRGYLRAEDIEENNALISVYDGTHRLDSFNLFANNISRELSLPGFDCLARFRVKLEEIGIPDTRAKLKVDNDYIEVTEGQRFLKNRCYLRSIEKYGLAKIVEISCREDDGPSRFELSIKPSFKIKVGQDSGPSNYDLGQRVYKDSSGNAYYLVYAGYLGINGNQRVLDTGKQKDLFVVLYETKDRGLKLEKQELSYLLREVDSHVKKSVKGDGNLDFGSFKFIGKNINQNVLSINGLKGGIGLVGFADANDVVFEDLDKSGKNTDNINNLETSYNKANEDFNKIINDFSDERWNNNPATLGEEAFYEAIKLADNLGQKKRVSELCEKFKDRYPESKIGVRIDSFCEEDYLEFFNEGNEKQVVMVMGKPETIILEDVLEPSLDDYSVELIVQSRDNKNPSRFRLGKNQLVYLSDQKDEYVELVALKRDRAVLEVKLKPSTAGENGDVAYISKTFVLEKNRYNSFGSDYVFSIGKIYLNNYAKVSIIPRIEDTETKTNFTFQIGIEKRSFKLSPEKTKEKIKDLNETIEKWKDRSDKLGKVIKGFKGACLSVGGFMILKNLYANLDGKSIARQKVMRDKGGWKEKCSNALITGELNGKKVNYGSLDECYNDNSAEIDREVDFQYKILKQQQEDIKQLEEKSGAVSQGENILGFSDKIIDTERFMVPYTKNVRERLEKLIPNLNCNNGENKKDSYNVDELITYDQWKNNNFGVDDLKDLDYYARVYEQNPDDITAKENLCDGLKKINKNSKEYLEIQKAKEELNNKLYLNGVEYSVVKTKKSITLPYYGGKINNPSSSVVIPNGAWVKIVRYNGKNYLVEIDKRGSGNNLHGVLNVYNADGTQKLDESDSDVEFIKNNLLFEKLDATGYKHPYKGSYPNYAYPTVRYYETEPYKGRPAIVPFDLNNGWYAAITQTLPVFGGIGSYEESGRVSSFYVCNVGENNKEDNMKGDDKCTMINLNTGQPYDQIPGFSDPLKAKRLVDAAVKAIEAASRAYPAKDYVLIPMRDGSKQPVRVGKPQVNIPDIQCQDLMSPSDCKILFNVCDPVVCPASRCDFGGAYPVEDVVQSGIIGSIVLCLPNFNRGIYVPVCLTGIKAGIDGLLSVYQAYHDCLQESLDTGQMVGICDEIYSIHLCDFFWRQTLPVANIIIPKFFEYALGQNVRGGGEYLSVMDAWKNAEKSVNYFTNYYATESYKAFKARVIEGVGQKICKNFVSVSYPDEGDLLDSLTNPESPPQFHARFDEIPFTTATNPPLSQYKVYYHIYAGKDSRAYYQVYLKGTPESSYYRDTSENRVVAYGYIPKGGYASKTVDFTGPSGYKELCIVVNGQEKCGFKQVSTSFAVNYIEDKYLQNIASNKNIQTEKECVSGTPNTYSFVSPNLQGAAEEYSNPAIYKRGIIRICSTENPGKNSDQYINTNKQRWVDVGYCDNKKLRCWLDTESVKGTIKNLGIKNNTLSDLSNHTLEILKQENKYSSDEAIDLINEIGEGSLKDSNEIINRVNNIYDKAYFNNIKGKLLLERGKAYGDIAIKIYNGLLGNNKEEKTKQSLETSNVLGINCNKKCQESFPHKYIGGVEKTGDSCEKGFNEEDFKLSDVNAEKEISKVCCCELKEGEKAMSSGEETTKEETPFEDRKKIAESYNFQKNRNVVEITKAIKYAHDNLNCNIDSKDYSSYANAIAISSADNNLPDPFLLLALMIHESNCDVSAVNGESKGLMQINEETFNDICRGKINGVTSYTDILGKNNFIENIKCGAKILRAKYDWFKNGKVFVNCSNNGKVKYYKWEAALRGYNGWSCPADASLQEQKKKTDEYVSDVMRIWKELDKKTSSSILNKVGDFFGGLFEGIFGEKNNSETQKKSETPAKTTTGEPSTNSGKIEIPSDAIYISSFKDKIEEIRKKDSIDFPEDETLLKLKLNENNMKVMSHEGEIMYVDNLVNNFLNQGKTVVIDMPVRASNLGYKMSKGKLIINSEVDGRREVCELDKNSGHVCYSLVSDIGAEMEGGEIYFGKGVEIIDDSYTVGNSMQGGKIIFEDGAVIASIPGVSEPPSIASEMRGGEVRFNSGVIFYYNKNAGNSKASIGYGLTGGKIIFERGVYVNGTHIGDYMDGGKIIFEEGSGISNSYIGYEMGQGDIYFYKETIIGPKAHIGPTGGSNNPEGSIGLIIVQKGAIMKYYDYTKKLKTSVVESKKDVIKEAEGDEIWNHLKVVEDISL